jgi:glucose/arabinose dehydrogenase
MKSSAIVCTASLLAAGCSPSDAQVFHSSAGNIAVETVARGLEHPWALAFLPDGRVLVTERPGRMRIVEKDGKLSTALAGVPKVFASGQGGLHDVVLDRGYAENHTIYFCYAEPVDGGARTALARARLVDEGQPKLDDVKVIFHQQGPLSSGNHFGCRIAQTPDDNLFMSAGEHFTTRDQAQNLGNHLGKIIRIRPDGSVPPDNPFVGRAALASEASGQRGNSIDARAHSASEDARKRADDTRPEPASSARAGARPEIWSYGHRNPQGLALHPATGKLWEHEHGPRGGDEINIIEKGKNYGWPVIGYGIDYNGAKIHESTQKAGMEQPIWYWVPSIAPSGMAFMTGNLFPAWRGNLFVGALAGQILVRLELDGEKVVKEERLLQQLRERIRDVRQGPDGALWLLTDNSSGRLLRVAPGK